MARAIDKTRWPEIVGLALAFLAALFMSGQRPFGFGDEGFSFLLSRAWAEGHPLFSEYCLIYPPGEHVLTGLPLLVFDSSLAAFRVGLVILTAIAAWLFARPVGSHLGAPLAILVCLTIAVVASPRPKLLAAALVLTAAVQVARGSGGGRWSFLWGFGAGLMVGVREDSALLLVIVAVVGTCLGGRPRDVSTRLLLGLLLGVGFWIALFAMRGEAQEFVFHLGHRLAFLFERLGAPTVVERPEWIWPLGLRRFKAFVALPLGLVVATAYAALLARALWLERATKRIDRVAVAALLVGLAYLPQFLVERPDFPHFVHHLPIALTVLCLAAPGTRWTRVALASLLIVGVVLTGWVVLARRHHHPLLPYPAPDARLNLPVEAAPPWAGTLGPGGLVVLGWSPGWYVAEGIDPPSRYLSTFPRHLDDRARSALADLVTDSEIQSVLTIAGMPVPPAVMKSLTERFERVSTWRGVTLWRRIS